jgi:amino acid adenylation domain-containing protein
VEESKRQLLAQLLEKAGVTNHAPDRLSPRRADTLAPLSFAQERFWFLQQWEPSNPAYNIARAYRLSGALDHTALARSVESIADRHEVLRSIFINSGDQPFQQLLPASALKVRWVDLRGQPRRTRNAILADQVAEETGRAFDLATGPLLRVIVYQLANEDYALIIVAHQSVFDGRSLDIFYRELEILYAAGGAAYAARLTPLSVQYADYAIWQRERQADGDIAAQLQYWKGKLAGALPALELPTDRPRSAQTSYKGARRKIVIDKRLTGALRKLSRNSATSMFVTLMAAFKVLLYRYTAEADIIVGFPVSNRDRPELENLIGSFVNTLALRSDLSGAPGFLDLLAQLRVGVQGAMSHRDLPFEQLVEELQPEREFDRNPVFQTMFTFQNLLPADIQLAGIRVEPIDCDAGSAKFHLTLALGERDGRLLGSFEYRSDLFDAVTIDRMIGHFLTLLKGIALNPARSISTLPMLTGAESKRIIIEWNDTAARFPKKLCVHDLFEAQVRKTPNAVAVECDGESLTYRELDWRANQLARHLKAFGTGVESLVAICLERSVELVIGMLGTLKAGAAYLPLDREYPGERLRYILTDARASILLTDQDVATNQRSKMDDRNSLSYFLNPRLKVIPLDRDRSKIATLSAVNVKRKLTPRNLAYVIYTSGSTGDPKGVEVEHHSLVACLYSLRRQLNFSRRDVWLAVSAITFDIASAEIFLPLLTGAKLVVATLADGRDGDCLRRCLDASRATVMQATPTTWRLLLETGWKPASELKMVCGGEALQPSLSGPLLSRGQWLWNCYGPTETTIWSTSCLVERGEGVVPIGRPIANTKIYLLDRALQPVPVGVPGEIYIGGAGVARGYLNRPELTRERFIANPFSRKRDDRLYRTGDLARYLPDGNIEYLGRLDNQVKLRGHRIELGEIESVLGRHPSIKECAVIARETVADSRFQVSDSRSPISTSEKQLVAYVVANRGTPPGVGDLRHFLRQTLPEFMVPTAFVALDALPLTPNGKLDRRGLPAPDPRRPSGAGEFARPRGEVEELIAQAWREVLQIEEVGTNDNFFDLGGHSLRATRVAARLRASLKVDLPLRKLFELPTIAELARFVIGRRGGETGSAGRPIAPVARLGDLPLSSAQQRLWYLHNLDPASSAYNIPAAYRVDGSLDVPALEAALGEIVQRHESLRSAVIAVNGQPAQHISARVALNLPVVDLTSIPADKLDAEVARRVSADAHAPYDLSRSPLMRAHLLRLSGAAHVLILNFHHIIADASSLANFYRELAILYEAFSAATDAGLAPLALQFADYASWQREWLNGSAAEAQLAYWRRQLNGVAPLDLPADFERPARPSYRGARAALRLPVDLTRALKQMSQRASVTLFMTLLAAFKILLARLSGRDDVVVGSTIAGRDRPELDGVIGFFINALALRSDLSGAPSFDELLARVRDTCLDAYTHQELPFDKIVEALDIERDFGRNPIFQVLFNMNEVGARSLKLADCRCEKIFQSEPAAKFDMVLYAPEIDGAIELALIYNADLFSGARMAQCLEQLGSILAQAVAAPEKSIAEITLTTAASRSVLPDPTVPLGDRWQGAVQESISRQASRVPERLALADCDDRWTYRELDEHSNRLANRLVRSGIRRHEVVAIYAERCAALSVALLGVLKAGAVFVILDPAYPVARLRDYLRIAKPKGWLAFESSGELPADLAKRLDDGDPRCRIELPRTRHGLAELLGDCEGGAPELSFDADHPAYIAFTSGSTGEPKGVRGRHGPMSHFLPWQEEIFSLDESDRYCLLSGLGYNHLQREVFTALASGASLYVPTAVQLQSPGQLIEWLRANEISVMHLTPALGRLMQSAGAAPLASLRRIFFGGDLLTHQDAAAMRALTPNAKIVSFYGATETQRAVGYFPVKEDSFNGARRSAVLPTGRGARDVQLLLLTPNGQLAGVGELGELYVRSPHLAAGYVGDAALTEANFLVNPFTQNPRDRLYRTGDLGRYRPDGDVEWVGRFDRRVSIRGFRVELAEVETALLQHPSVRAAAAVLNSKFKISDSKLSERLIAYVVADDGTRDLSAELRAFVAARLPHYMVPAEFVMIERLPLSPNGKVDYARLPAPSGEGAAPAQFEEPSSELERQLAEIFREVLEVARIGRQDDFFHLGGHSLGAAQAAARIRQRLNVGLDLRLFLEAPTVAALAHHLAGLANSPAGGARAVPSDREEIEL